MTRVLALLVLQCTLCLTIRVPVEWTNDESEVKNDQNTNVFAVQTFAPQNLQEKQIPKEYFQYPAKKPHFAIDVATFHGVPSPENHYRAHPVRPHTGVNKPHLGHHKILNNGRNVFAQYRDFVKNNKGASYVNPISSNYEIFHPYKAEEPALKQLYQDPVLGKIRADIHDNNNRLENYVSSAGKLNIAEKEYLEKPEQTDRKKKPHNNLLAPYEIHKPQRRPVYYSSPLIPNKREQILNKKIKHPWNQNYIKVTPNHYRGIKNDAQILRQQHALKYDDEKNEYPQIAAPQKYIETTDGYDIYEKGKEKYSHLKNKLDESINKVVQENRPNNYQNLELQNKSNKEQINSDKINDDDDEDNFAPVKNYAQVRKTETIKHLPRAAAFRDAETYDEIRNAPRLREAIKSTKAQTVYSEEGYEDSAYDHAGEQKQASDHERHGGYLKENESSKGKYKIPSFSGSYTDAKGSEYKDKVLDGEQWKNSEKDNKEHEEEEDYSEEEHEELIESNEQSETPRDQPNIKSETSIHAQDNKKRAAIDSQHDVSKREANFKVPEINLNSTFFNQNDILKMAPTKTQPNKFVDLSEKYPYYNKNIKTINKDSPLRYAENLTLIPKKSKGGTEFYDSRSQIECSEVEDNIDPVPEKLKKGGHPDDNSEDNEGENGEDSDKGKDKQRLNGLGDKIDCFKIKYFGENPLDSPFFKEEIIVNPEPVTAPTSKIFKLSNHFQESETGESKFKNILVTPKNIIIDHKQLNVSSEKNSSLDNEIKLPYEPYFYMDIINKIREKSLLNNKSIEILNNSKILSNYSRDKVSVNDNLSNTTDNGQQLTTKRKKRSAPFVYEPYKIIRDSHFPDSKKTTTSSNVSPLIKQLQSSRVVNRVLTTLNKDQPVKRNTGHLSYKNIGKRERERATDKEGTESSDSININEDSRRSVPKYERRPINHNQHYQPVENRKSISFDAYQNRTNHDKPYDSSVNQKQKIEKATDVIVQPFQNVSRYDQTSSKPKKGESKETREENNDQVANNSESKESNTSDEDYEEYDDEEEYNTKIKSSSISTLTTVKPIIENKKASTKTNHENDTKEKNQPHKLRLITRFRNPHDTEDKFESQEVIDSQYTDKNKEADRINIPKYREKKKKSSKRTFVTDTKTYGDGEDDMRNDEVDALIGVQHDIEDYIPTFEKEMKLIGNSKENVFDSAEEDDNSEYNNSEETDDEDSEENEEVVIEKESNENSPEITTAEPTKRTLLKTTEAPEITSEASKSKLEIKPIISKKKIQIHKELPINKTSPNVTQFKQDIKEVEIIKEIPSRHLQKNKEALDLYKDEHLAKNVNKLIDVEVFKEDLDLINGPKHGGNYRSIESADSEHLPSSVSKTPNYRNVNHLKNDSDMSQSETIKVMEADSSEVVTRRYDENVRARSQNQRQGRSRGQSSKLKAVNPTLPSVKGMHGGNLQLTQNRGRNRGERKNAKLLELNDKQDNEDNVNPTENMHGVNFKSHSSSRNNGYPLHGGNYRSAKIIQTESSTPRDIYKENKDESKNVRRNSAKFLDTVVRAIPVLTTTPAYILDPSKRMYYYVDS